ncbi:hypothetical protein [Arthrobacter sp. TMS1-12-1]
MSDDKSAKRVEPRMNRGSFRLQFIIWSVWTVLQLLLFIGNVLSGEEWAFGEYLSAAALLLGLTFLGYLLYVRRRDEHHWRAEEERQADWERRGRAL